MFNSKFSRRQFLKATAAATVLPTLSSLSNVSFASNGLADHTVVNVFLRGGMDSLNAIIPYSESAYWDARPSIKIPEEGCTILNNQFALHEALANHLYPLYESGDLALVVATGLISTAVSRSHFEMQRHIESGGEVNGLTDGGWLGRYLNAASPNDATFRGVGMGKVPKSLQGYDYALGLSNLATFALTDKGGYATLPTLDTISKLYQDHSLHNTAINTVTALEGAKANDLGSTPRPADYGDSQINEDLHQVAELINKDLGLEAATVNMGGWDMHTDVGRWNKGRLKDRFSELGTALAAFYNEIAAHKNKVTIVVMSEFGRRVRQNSSGGLDHGKGGAMMVLGGGINGGQVYGDWPGLDEPNEQNNRGLDGGDLRITTDYRQVLAELVDVRLGHPDRVSLTLPEYDYDPLNDNYLGIFN